MPIQPERQSFVEFFEKAAGTLDLFCLNEKEFARNLLEDVKAALL